MSYHNLLYMYGSEQDSAEQRVCIYVQNPKKLTSQKDVTYRDKNAAETITRLQNLIEDLQDYRVALAARYGELETMLYTRTLSLERCPHWKGHIEYIVTITKQMEDGTKIDELNEVFRGKDRKAAFARFEEIKKNHPGIITEIDVEKRSWER